MSDTALPLKETVYELFARVVIMACVDAVSLFAGLVLAGATLKFLIGQQLLARYGAEAVNGIWEWQAFFAGLVFGFWFCNRVFVLIAGTRVYGKEEDDEDDLGQTMGERFYNSWTSSFLPSFNFCFLYFWSGPYLLLSVNYDELTGSTYWIGAYEIPYQAMVVFVITAIAFLVSWLFQSVMPDEKQIYEFVTKMKKKRVA